VSAEPLRCRLFGHEAGMVPSETQYAHQHGYCDDELHRFWPGVNCMGCGRFVGRDGHCYVETFEMSDVVASVEGICRRCLEREAAGA
jgi:hypothetical protein